MAEKFNTSDLSKNELAGNLRKPEGDNGVEVGKQMNKGNEYISKYSYEQLKPIGNEKVLEIGMGNGFFVPYLMKLADVDYTGLDYSPLMVSEAEKLNNELKKQRRIKFIEGSVEKVPFEDHFFDAIVTANTIYFWPNVVENAKELLRVLKPGGRLLVAYRNKELLDKIEFTKYGFNKYEISEVEEVFEKSGFKNISTKVLDEPALDFDGKPLTVKGVYTIAYK